jgi:putative aldouronate transport system permease protein
VKLISSKYDKVFDTVNYLILTVVIIVILYPLYFTIIASVSNPQLVGLGKIILYPRGVTLDAYYNVFSSKEIWVGYRNTIFYTCLGVLINLFVTIPCAFALARRNLSGRNMFMLIFVFTMFFHGGMIPNYILVKQLGMLDTVWAMVLPQAMSVFNMIITRTFFQTNIPEELYESAKMDGCSDFGMFFKIALPLSKSIIAVMALFYGVWHWNQFFSALIYLTHKQLFPLQLVLRNILLLNEALSMANMDSMTADEMDAVAKKVLMAESMKYALIFIASFPVLVAYPFAQKYFVKGVMIGSLKG